MQKPSKKGEERWKRKVQSAFCRQVGPVTQADLEHCRGHTGSPQQSQQPCLLPEQNLGARPESAWSAPISTASLSPLEDYTDQLIDIKKSSGGAEIIIIYD